MAPTAPTGVSRFRASVSFDGRNSLAALPSSPIPYAVFRLWAGFWVARDANIPPFVYYANTLRGGAVLATGAPEAGVCAFVASQAGHTRYDFSYSGSALLEDWQWLGHWSLLSVEVKHSHQSVAVSGS